MIKLWMLPLVFGLVSYYPSLSSCPPKCLCKDTAMRCTMDDLRSLKTVRGENITSLSLARNKIKHIPPGVFKGFVRLQFLDLENNHIHSVSQDAFHPLQSLRHLNLRGNRYKHLPSTTLFLPSLEKLQVDASRSCESCEINLSSKCPSDERRESRTIPPFGNVTGLCLSVSCLYYPSSSCRSNQMDKSDVNFAQYATLSITQGNVSNFNNTDASRTSTSLLVGSIELKTFIFILGLLAVLINLVTVTVVFTSSQLKRISTMVLAGHIAVCDFFVGLFLLVVAVLAFDYEERRYIDSSKRYVCPVIISFRSAGLIVEPVVLFLMTMDRYKRIVNHSKPPLSRRCISLAACFAWFIAIVVVSIGSVGFMKEVNYGSLCSRVNSSTNSIDSYIERAVIASSALLFVSCCIMYFRIYRVVKTQNQRMGTQTYVRVSKLIFALVLSTMVFWYVPAIAVAFFGRQNTASKEVRHLIILIAFTLNSLVNPFLYVLREKKFRQEISPSCKCRTTRRRENPSRHSKNSFQVYEVAMVDIKDVQSSSNCCNSDETSNGYSTSL
ncbi:follicle-stimulating hormone receptor-like isoform X2 [Oculina patagonica]